MQDKVKAKDYKEQMFQAISSAIENTGKTDDTYDNYKKASDILDVLEHLLAYTIYTTCISAETIRDSCDESHVNIRKQALMMMEHEKGAESDKGGESDKGDKE